MNRKEPYRPRSWICGLHGDRDFQQEMERSKKSITFSGKILSVAAIQHVMQELHFDFFYEREVTLEEK